jgi:ADP-heptose:LPS heptosyltransferase
MLLCVIRLDHLGDLIITTPLIRSLALAGHEVDVLAHTYSLPLLDHNPRIRSAFAIEQIAPAFPRGWAALAGWLRARRYDGIVLPYARPRQLLLASAFSGARTRIAMWGGWLGRATLHRCLRSGLPERPRHFAEVSLDCARALGAEPGGAAPELFLTDAERTAMRRMLAARFGDRPVTVIHPGSGGNACNLPEKEYAAFAELLLARTDRAIAVTGTAGERNRYEAWPRELLDSPRFWLSAGELTLRQLMALIAETELLVCGSTGPLHIASGLGKRSLSPFCPVPAVSASLWGNIGGEGLVIEQPRDRCQRCKEAGAGHCDFQGVITAETLFQALPR